MKKTNWAAMEKSAKLIKKNVKNLQQAGEFLREFPEDGYMRDNISKNLIEIKTAKSSSLRRYVKLLENFYFKCYVYLQRNIILKDYCLLN